MLSKAGFALLVLFAFVYPAAVLAEPGTFTVTPTLLEDDGTGGLADGFRVYRDCDLPSQAKGSVVADPAAIGVPFDVTGDDTNPPVLCGVAFNAAGESAFSNTVTLSSSQLPPGAVRIELDCTFVSTATGEVKDCSGFITQ